ncbi:MAG: Zinc uptake regulation protein [Actinomycetota bacterium]|jgi:Fur family ferric uptake transcriptional regulator
MTPRKVPAPEAAGALQRAGLRPTRQRGAVLAALAAADDFRTVAQWHEAIGRRGDAVGLTTVYRTLAALADAELLDTVVDESGEVRYRRCGGAHHHHLLCRSCGTTHEIAAPEVEQWAAGVAAEHDFADISHTVEIFGICGTCRARGESSAAVDEPR